MTDAAMAARRRRELVRQALIFDTSRVAWMVLEAAVAIGAGVAARSITLLAFGIDSLIELASAVVLIWPLTAGPISLRRSPAQHRPRAQPRRGGQCSKPRAG